MSKSLLKHPCAPPMNHLVLLGRWGGLWELFARLESPWRLRLFHKLTAFQTPRPHAAGSGGPLPWESTQKCAPCCQARRGGAGVSLALAHRSECGDPFATGDDPFYHKARFLARC